MNEQNWQAFSTQTIRLPQSMRGLGPPRLRVDRVARRVVRSVQEAASTFVPDRLAVLFTVTAPIRMGSKTAAALSDRIAFLTLAGASAAEGPVALHGNTIRLRLIGGARIGAPRAVGFVHNPDGAPEPLMDVVAVLLRTVDFVGERAGRTLILEGPEGSGALVREAVSLLDLESRFETILFGAGGGAERS